jgi:hypothetical protein
MDKKSLVQNILQDNTPLGRKHPPDKLSLKQNILGGQNVLGEKCPYPKCLFVIFTINSIEIFIK